MTEKKRKPTYLVHIATLEYGIVYIGDAEITDGQLSSQVFYVLADEEIKKSLYSLRTSIVRL